MYGCSLQKADLTKRKAFSALLWRFLRGKRSPHFFPLVNDGYCDTELNSAEFDFDGGDCIGVTTKASTFASICGVSLTYIGDGICNPWINYPECQFDGGDCCMNGEFSNWCMPRNEKPGRTPSWGGCKN